jgi:hypothetical protein
MDETSQQTEISEQTEDSAGESKTRIEDLIEKLKAVSGATKDQPAMKMWQSIDAGYQLVETIKSLGLFTKRPPLRKAARKLAEMGGVYPVPNFAVDACVIAWKETMTEQAAKVDKDRAQRQFSPEEMKAVLPDIRWAGKLAYCEAMPQLSTRDDVSDFIACVVHGIALEIIPPEQGTRLLYGAQVAGSSFPPRKKYKKRAKQTSQATNAPSATPAESAA